jgi:hypothetical protein
MKTKHTIRHFSRQSGVSILETVIALGLLLVTNVGIMTIASVAITATENQGHEAARAAEYAQDKMEQLMSLSFGDGDPPATSGTDTTQFPAVNSGGTGLAVGGGSDPNNPVSGYVDYLDAKGNPLTITGGTAPNNWFYVRVWQVQTVSSTLKQLTVTAMVRNAVGKNGAAPQATVTSLKSSPF